MGEGRINPNGCSAKILKIKIEGDFGWAEDFRREFSAFWQLGKRLPGCIVLVWNELFDFFEQFKYHIFMELGIPLLFWRAGFKVITIMNV